MSKSSRLYGPLEWRKATASNPSGSCVQVAKAGTDWVALRNSRDPNGPVLLFTRNEVAAFLDGAKKREFDDLA